MSLEFVVRWCEGGSKSANKCVTLLHEVQAARDAAEADAAQQRASLQAQVQKALKHCERYLSPKVVIPYLNDLHVVGDQRPMEQCNGCIQCAAQSFCLPH